MKIQKETVSLFDQDKQYVFDYLKARDVDNAELDRIIRDYQFGLLEDTHFYVSGEEYCISHFLSKSEIVGYDIRKVNALLGTETTDVIAFAVVEGDDVICYETKRKTVFLWRVQTDNGVKLHVSDDLTKFLEELE